MEEHGIIVTPEIVEVATPYGPSEKIGRVGVVAGAREILNIGPGAAAYYGVTDSWRMTVGVFNGLMDIVVGRRSIEDLVLRVIADPHVGRRSVEHRDGAAAAFVDTVHVGNRAGQQAIGAGADRKSTRLNSSH